MSDLLVENFMNSLKLQICIQLFINYLFFVHFSFGALLSQGNFCHLSLRLSIKWSILIWKANGTWNTFTLAKTTLLNIPLWGIFPYMQFFSFYIFISPYGRLQYYSTISIQMLEKAGVGKQHAKWWGADQDRSIQTEPFGERRILGVFLIFITLFISPLWTWQWQIEKLKIQNLPRIQRQGYFSITSSISNSVPSIYSSAWLAKFLYHAQPCISLH